MLAQSHELQNRMPVTRTNCVIAQSVKTRHYTRIADTKNVCTGVIYASNEYHCLQLVLLYLTVDKHRQVLGKSRNHAALVKAVEIYAARRKKEITDPLLPHLTKLTLYLLRKDLDHRILQLACCTNASKQNFLHAQCVTRRKRNTIRTDLVNLCVLMVKFNGKKGGSEHAVAGNYDGVAVITACGYTYGH